MGRSTPSGSAVGVPGISVRGGVLISGGGTAGHVLPGLAVARALVGRGVVDGPSSVHLVGSRRGIEKTLVPEAGFGLTVLPGRGLQRRLTPVNLMALWGLAVATVWALLLMIRRRPRVLLATGGYASVPCGVAAILLRVPLVVAEQNAVPGAANSLLARFARQAAVSFTDTGLPREVVTGNPVREEIRVVRSPAERLLARGRLGLDGRPFVLVFGGSLGARRINWAVTGAVRDWVGEPVVVHHVIGRRDWPDAVADPVRPGRNVDYRAVEYEDDMPTMLAAADLVVCRAGATTVAELCVIGLPAVLVPLPGAPRDHQTLNARRLADAGAAVLVADDELDGDRLREVVGGLLGDRASLGVMAAASLGIGRPDAADLVAELLAGMMAGRAALREGGDSG